MERSTSLEAHSCCKTLRVIHTIDEQAAKEIAHVLGYKIYIPHKKVFARQTLDQVINYLSQQLFQYLVNEANKEGYHFKASADEFEKYIKKILTSKLR
jgi:hypothetical protein